MIENSIYQSPTSLKDIWENILQYRYIREERLVNSKTAIILDRMIYLSPAMFKLVSDIGADDEGYDFQLLLEMIEVVVVASFNELEQVLSVFEHPQISD